MKAAMEWLRENRCPWCRNRIWCKRDYKVEKAYVGWKCSGYRCDEERRFTA